MNTVEIDPAALEAEAQSVAAREAYENAVEAVPLEGAQPVEGVVVESWSPIIVGTMPMVRMYVVPQWELTDEESQGFGESLAKTLDLFFPGGLDGKYACCVQLVALSAGIVLTRKMNGRTLAFGPAKKNDEPSADTKKPN